MKGFVQDIEGLAVKNAEFRRVLYTAKHCQLVLMALMPKEEIGAEVHKLDQFFRVEQGSGEAVLDGVRTEIRAGFAVWHHASTTRPRVFLTARACCPSPIRLGRALSRSVSHTDSSLSMNSPPTGARNGLMEYLRSTITRRPRDAEWLTKRSTSMR